MCVFAVVLDDWRASTSEVSQVRTYCCSVWLRCSLFLWVCCRLCYCKFLSVIFHSII